MKAKVHVSKEIWRRLGSHQGLLKALGEFVACLRDGNHPPRKFKASGTEANGDVFEPYRSLNLYHHHLHRKGDPLIVLQMRGEDLYSIAITTHQDFFRGDRYAWLKCNHAAIDWSECEELYEEVMAYDPPET